MKLNIAISVCALALAAGGTAFASSSSSSNMSSVYRAATHPSPPPPTSSTSSTRSTTVIGEDRFRPYKGTSTYSNRGGVNSYPAPAKPKGYRPY